MESQSLVPTCGWEKFEDNLKVSDFIYSRLGPLASSGKIDYENFISGYGEFSNETGFLAVKYLVPSVDNDETEIEFLLELKISFQSTGTNNIFELLMVDLQFKFGLVKSTNVI